MPATKVILIACGSFNPPTNMHLRMFEIARDYLHRMGNYTVIGGLISPVHDSYGKNGLVSATHRLAMVRLALQSSDWIKLSDWECNQESWSRTRSTLQYHQNHVNAMLNQSNNEYNVNDDDLIWVPENIRNSCNGPILVKLLCGADLLESFGTPGLWADEDIETIVGHHGLVVITREKTDPLKFIYDSDILTKYSANISIVTEWIRNEVSSTKIRRALRRSESVKYLLPDKVVDYIQKQGLYGCKNTKYLPPPVTQYNSNFLTPSPTDVSMESPNNTFNPCIAICNRNIFSSQNDNNRMTIDTVDAVIKTNELNTKKHPGQAVKIIIDSAGEHKVFKEASKKAKLEVCKTTHSDLKCSKSLADFDSIQKQSIFHGSRSDSDCKSCDENLIKFIFTKHGIQVISDVETIV